MNITTTTNTIENMLGLFKSTPHGLTYKTYNFLLNTNKIFHNLSDFKWYATAHGVTIIQITATLFQFVESKKYFRFDVAYGKYLKLKKFNIHILAPEIQLWNSFSGVPTLNSHNTTFNIQYSRLNNQQFQVRFEDDYGWSTQIVQNRMNAILVLEGKMLNMVQSFKLIPAAERLDFMLPLLQEAEENYRKDRSGISLHLHQRWVDDILQHLGMPVSDVVNRRKTYLTRMGGLRKILFRWFMGQKGLPAELVWQIYRDVVQSEMYMLEVLQFTSLDMFYFDAAPNPLDLLFEGYQLDMRVLLLLAGDVEMNPGPIFFFNFKILILFLIYFYLFLYYYLNFSLFPFILLNISFYIIYQLMLQLWVYKVEFLDPKKERFIMNVKTRRERLLKMLKLKFEFGYGDCDSWQSSLNVKYNKYTFILVILWLFFWAAVPLSTYTYYINLIAPFRIPNIVLEIVVPVAILFVPGVDILNPEFYIMSRPDKVNGILDVMLPYGLAYVYFFSIEISWTSMYFLNVLYISYLGALLYSLCLAVLFRNNATGYVMSFWFNFLILLLPVPKVNLKYLVGIFIFSFLTYYQIAIPLLRRQLNYRKKWLGPIHIFMYSTFFHWSLKLLKLIAYVGILYMPYFILYEIFRIVTRSIIRVMAVVEFLALFFLIVLYFLPDTPDQELEFEWIMSYEPGETLEIEDLIYSPNEDVIREFENRASYYWMDRGQKLKGGSPIVDGNVFQLINDFETYSNVDERVPRCYYTPNFDLFLQSANKQVEEDDNLWIKLKELKQKLADLNDEEDIFEKRATVKKCYNVVSGKMLKRSYEMVMWLKSKRYKLKPVWMTLAQVPKLKWLPSPPKVDKMKHLLPKKKFIMETLGNSINKAKEVWNIQETKDRYLRPSGKACKQEPLLADLAKQWKTQGANSFKYNSEEYIKSSISRYFEKPTRLEGDDKRALKEAAEALVFHNPKLYGNASLWSPEHIVKKTVLKYSCQFPLTNNPNWKSKRDVIKALGKPEVLRVISDYIRSGHYFRSLHTVFLKLAVVNRPKIEANPGKQRTITAQDWLNYSLGMFVCGSVNKRFDFDSNSAPFTPILTGGLVRLASRLLKHKYFAAMDFTAADSYFSSLIDGVIEVRKLGYKNNVDFDYIANVLEAYYEGLETSVIINREQGRKYWKLRGFSTGHANTTPDNTIAEQIAMLMAWRALTNRPFHEYYLYNDQPAYGDDNILGSSYSDLKTWNATNISKYITEKLGIPCRVEWEGNTLNGATFLAKRFCTDERVLRELKELGIKTPVAIIQDEEKLRQNFTVNLKNANPKFIWNYAIGYLLQTASLPHVYADIHKYLFDYLREHNVNEETIQKFKKMQKIPTYQEVMLMTYANRTQRKQGWVDHEPILPSKIVDTFKTGVGYLAGQLQIFENLTRSLRQFIPDAPEDHTKPLLIKQSTKDVDPQDFLLEAFIYYKADAPDMNFFKELCATSPYSTMLQPEIFGENLDVILPAISIPEALSIPNVMTLVFYGINSSTKLWFNPLGWIQYLNKWISKFYLEANYFWWTCTGRSSATLSKMVPKDPAYYEKRCAYWIARRLRNYLPNIYLDFRPYALDALVSNFVITTPDCPRKVNPHWDNAMPKVVSMLNKHKHITLKARTASGKTYFLPQLLKDYFPYITILTVNNVLVKNNSTPGFAKVLHDSRLQQDSKYRTMTYGLWQALKMRPREGEILLLDEFAERDEALYYAVDTCHTFSIAMSATPKVEGLDERPFIEVVVPRDYQIYEHSVKDYEEAIGKCIELGLMRWLIIIPNIEKVKAFAKSMNKTGYPATAVYAGNSNIPTSGHIVATTLVDSGVDIGDLDAVIDTGKSVKQINGCLRTVNSNASVIEQRKGRVGRRQDGHYFRLSSSSVSDDYSKEISFFTALFQPSVSNRFGIKTPCLLDISEPLPPLFLKDDEILQNTINLAYLSLRVKRKFADAAKFYYATIAGRNERGNEYIVGRYDFQSMLFDKALEILDRSSHRFSMCGENELVYNGKEFMNVKVRFSRSDFTELNAAYISTHTNGVLVDLEQLEEMTESFRSKFTPLTEPELNNMRSLELVSEDEKQFIRKLFDL